MGAVIKPSISRNESFIVSEYGSSIESTSGLLDITSYRTDRIVVEKRACYSLIVSISTTDTSVDLYDRVENEINVRVKTGVVTEISLP